MYAVYRDGSGDLESRVKKAVAAFYRQRGALPARIVVNPTEAAAGAEAVKALGLAVPVEGSGGCLIPEVWLEVPGDGGA